MHTLTHLVINPVLRTSPHNPMHIQYTIYNIYHEQLELSYIYMCIYICVRIYKYVPNGIICE